jgi:mono/diheme cytochrome c family protein
MRFLGPAVFALWLAGCGSARRAEPLIGPLDLDPLALRGERVFMEHCQACHPGGEAGVGPALNDKPLPGFARRAQIRAGLGAMPAFSADEIAPDALRDLIAYLDALRHAGPP